MNKEFMKMSIIICFEYFCMIYSYTTGTEQKNYLVMIKIDPVVRKRASVFFQEWTPRENPKNMKKRRGRGGGRKIVLKTKGLMS